MWYRIKQYQDDGFSRKFVDSRVLAELTAEQKHFEIETKNKWIEGVIKEFDCDEYSDGMVLDAIIKLIDEGECYV